MSFFTILFFLLCLRFTTYTYKHEHSHKSPHFPPNLFNLFTDISHFESFHLFPSSCLSVSPHLLLFINSSIRFRPRSSYPPSLLPSLSHGTLILLLLAGDVELNPGHSPLNFTHLNIRSIRSFQKSFSLHNYLADHPTDILSLKDYHGYCTIISGVIYFNKTIFRSIFALTGAGFLTLIGVALIINGRRARKRLQSQLRYGESAEVWGQCIFWWIERFRTLRIPWINGVTEWGINACLRGARGARTRDNLHEIKDPSLVSLQKKCKNKRILVIPCRWPPHFEIMCHFMQYAAWI